MDYTKANSTTPNGTQATEIERRNVALYPHNWAVVDGVSARFDLGNVSGALRYIINEYVRLAAQEAARLQE